jgi:hypothetical protein
MVNMAAAGGEEGSFRRIRIRGVGLPSMPDSVRVLRSANSHILCSREGSWKRERKKRGERRYRFSGFIFPVGPFEGDPSERRWVRLVMERWREFHFASLGASSVVERM